MLNKIIVKSEFKKCSSLLLPRWTGVINPQAYETDKELGRKKNSETKQNKQTEKKQIPTMPKPIDVRDFLATSHDNNKKTY